MSIIYKKGGQIRKAQHGIDSAPTQQKTKTWKDPINQKNKVNKNVNFVSPGSGDSLGSNYFGAGLDFSTDSGRLLSDLNEAQAHSFRRGQNFMDPGTNKESNFGTWQDTFINDRSGFDKNFNSNSQLLNTYGNSQNYYDEGLRRVNQTVRRRSNGLDPVRFAPYSSDDISNGILDSPKSLGATYNNFKNRPGVVTPSQKSGGLLYK